MPFDFHHRDRIVNLLEELEQLRYRDITPIEEFDWYEDDGTIGNREPKGDAVKVKKGYIWSGWDRYNWLCTKVTIPARLKDKDVLGIFDFGAREGTGNNGNFESLLYVNGKPYQAADGNHKEVFFQLSQTGMELELKFRLWSGLNGGGRPAKNTMQIRRADIGYLDTDTDNFYYLAKTAMDTYDILPPENEHREWLLNTVVEAFKLLNYTEPASEAFYESVSAAYTYLDSHLDGRGKPAVNVSLVGHTHIDVAWLWRLQHTREKAARSFSTANRLMERYDDYIFLQSQAQLYEYIKNDYPDIYEQIKKRAAEGKWEPSGAMWVECDCNIASGESIIRQILVGKNFFKDEFGYENDFLWLPDVFGYSWALPQILKKSGVNTFMTTKISWNDTNKMPYDTFKWRGMDGTEVTTHFVTTPDGDASSYTYNGQSEPSAVFGVWKQYSNKDLNRDLLISYGYGDGGGGPTRNMIKTIACENKLPGLPVVKTEKASSYFQRLNKTLEENPLHGYLPVWDGELYLEFHRGTYTSQAYNKKTNRQMEYLLRNTELLSVMAAVKGVSYDREKLLKAWKIVLCHQFHDILPGSSIKEVYDDSRVEYKKAADYISQVMEPVKKALYTEEKKAFTVFNNTGWVRDSYVEIPYVEIPDNTYTRYTDQAGRELPFASVAGKTRVYVEKMKPFSFTVIYGSNENGPEKTKAPEELKAVSPYYEVEWNPSGQLTRIYDKEAKREILPKGRAANELQIFEDKPRFFDAWEMEPTIDDKKELIQNCTGIKTEVNALGTFVTFTWQYNKSVITQTMCLYNQKKRIDFQTNVDWQETQKMLKTAFPADIRAVDARFDIQDGNIRRPITRNTSWEAAKFEVAAHKWVDLWETGYGIAVLNDCKYGHDVKEDTIRLTLLKSATDPDYCADKGTHEFTYSLLPHHAEWYAAQIEQEAFDLNNPIYAVAGGSAWEGGSFLDIEGENVMVDAVKLAEKENRVIIRFHEFGGSRKMVHIHGLSGMESWQECNLMEEAITEESQDEIALFVKPYEIKTISVKMKDF